MQMRRLPSQSLMFWTGSRQKLRREQHLLQKKEQMVRKQLLLTLVVLLLPPHLLLAIAPMVGVAPSSEEEPVLPSPCSLVLLAQGAVPFETIHVLVAAVAEVRMSAAAK